jgi:hypothetical protein
VVSRTIRIYDEQGRIAEEQQILDNPETIIPAESRSRILKESGMSLEDLREQLTRLMGGQAGPFSIAYSYDTRGNIKQTLRRIFIREEVIETTYNEQGDKAADITREKQISSQKEESAPIPGLPAYSEVRYSYEYDEHNNWVKEIISYRSSPDGTFESSSEHQRTLSYY